MTDAPSMIEPKQFYKPNDVGISPKTNPAKFETRSFAGSSDLPGRIFRAQYVDGKRPTAPRKQKVMSPEIQGGGFQSCYFW